MTTLNAVAYIVSGGIEILVPMALGFYVTRKFSTKWKSWFVGALMFLLSLIRLPVNSYASNLVASMGMNQYTFILIYLVASLTAGIFEESARYVGLRYLIKQDSYEEGVTYGAGHGGIESIMVVGLNVITIGFVLLSNPESLTEAQLYSIVSMPWYLPLVGAYERIMTMTIHICLSVMVLESIRNKNLRYYLLAIVIHTAIDYMTVSSVTRSIWYAELIITGFAIGLAQWAYPKVKNGLTDDMVSPQP